MDANNIKSNLGGCWKFGAACWLLLIATLAVLLIVFSGGLASMMSAWRTDEYSHGYMLPLVTAFLVWQKSSLLAQMSFRSSWWGFLVTLLGLVFYVVGELGALYTIIQYGFLITLAGVLLALLGSRAFKIILPAYLVLLFTIPLPAFLYNNLSSQLQLVSSQLGVGVIRLVGISVFLEGNVIDLGNYQLQVVEACSGLRYLFPFSALGFIAAILFRGAFWKKVILFVSTLPITILMNSFRIGVIGVLVDRAGVGMAEGFLHDFEGWIVFMACAAILVAEMWLLARIGPDRIPFSEAFAIEGPEPLPEGATRARRRLTPSFYAVLPLLVMALGVSVMLPNRAEAELKRAPFALFPLDIGEWHGKVGVLESIYVDALKLDDYLLVDYSDAQGQTLNLYAAYYESQRKGASAHSPKSCLPGGGWRIQALSQWEVPGVNPDAEPFRVNRSLIQMGDERLLVYYWFQQRGRIIANEYLVKWYLFWDALTRNRTDGALVRITTAAPLGDSIEEKDQLVADFIRVIEPRLERFVPN
ncbi:VPLPA-CTERM-specific exosortase XrtD [Thiorhodococcus mannitoliphagus]|nr:VPLPA-CTERM-specific exosortase XrtD [Thiorhodococcus mannitoliphagus]